MSRRALMQMTACLAALAVAGAAVGCGGSSSEGKTTPQNVAALGRRVFAEHCQSCHGMNGRTPTGTTGEYGPNFDDVKFTSRQYVDFRVEYGGIGMQTFAEELTPSERRAIVDFVYNTAGSRVRDGDVPARDFEHGRQVFERNCASCHAIAGRPATGRPTWPGTDFGEVTPSYDLVVERTIHGYYWWMPSFRDQFGEDDVKPVARWVEKVAGGHPFRSPMP